MPVQRRVAATFVGLAPADVQTCTCPRTSHSRFALRMSDMDGANVLTPLLDGRSLRTVQGRVSFQGSSRSRYPRVRVGDCGSDGPQHAVSLAGVEALYVCADEL